jgi:hypothetical protein
VRRGERATRALLAAVRAGRQSPQALWESLRSRFAHWDHADTWRLKERFLRDLDLYEPWPR